MAKQPLTTSRIKAAQIKNETVDAANTATRVGTFLENLNDSAVQEYDATAAYSAGQIVVFNGYLAQSVAATVAGQSPAANPSLWSVKIVLDSAAIAIGNFSPVSANALQQLIDSGALGGDGADVPNASTTVFGKARQATIEEQVEGIVTDAYSTPEGVFALMDALEITQKSLLELAVAASAPDKSDVIEQLGIKLSDLVQFITDQNININGASGNLNVYTDGTGNRGMAVLKNDILNFFAGQYFDGAVGISDGIGQRIGMNPVGTFIITPYIQAGGADTLLRSAAFTTLRGAERPLSNLCTLEIDNTSGQYTLKAVTPDQLLNFVLPAFQPILSGIQAGGVRKVGIVSEICYYDENIPADTTFSTAITPEMVGVQQTHNLQVPKEGMIRRLYNINGDPETEMVLTMTGNQYWQLDYPEGITEGYAGGAIELQKLTN